MTSSSTSSPLPRLHPDNTTHNHNNLNTMCLSVKLFLSQQNVEFTGLDSSLKVLSTIMESVETLKLDTPVNKKESVLTIFKIIVSESTIDNDIKEDVLKMIENGTLSATIDLVVSATKGELGLNKQTKRRILSCHKLCR